MNNLFQARRNELEEEKDEDEQEQQENEEDQDEEKIQQAPVNRLRSHSLNPNHSKEDFIRRKSAADVSSHLELSKQTQELEQTNTPPPRRPSSAMWFQRRFTAFSIEQSTKVSTNQSRRMTTGRFSNADLLRPRRPKILSQMMESFVRRFSLRKKKTNQDSEQDEAIVDPVYETLRIAAETRKMTLANYLQQRQQTFNKQTSLNSQGSSELDIQASPRASRHASRTETEIASSLRPPLPPPSASAASTHSSAIDRARVSNC